MCSRNNYNDDVVLDEIEFIEVDGWETGGRGPPKHKVVLKACYLIFTDTGLCGAFRATRILALEFLSQNEKRSRKRRGAKCPR